jgi:hypothetical protein
MAAEATAMYIISRRHTAHGWEPRVGFPWEWFELFRRIFRTTYKQAANTHSAGAEFSMFDPRKFVFWRGNRLRNGQTMVYMIVYIVVRAAAA